MARAIFWFIIEQAVWRLTVVVVRIHEFTESKAVDSIRRGMGKLEEEKNIEKL